MNSQTIGSNPSSSGNLQVSALLKTEYPILIPYQIDFQTGTIGRHISLTKRYCVWRFGFAHIPSILASKRGVANRGIEFEIRFIWSVASGKHELFMNNICISSSLQSHSAHQQRSSFKFDHTFNIPQSILPGGHILHITAYNQPLQQMQDDRQYILRFDGQKFTHFSKIYQLGSENMINTYSTIIHKLQQQYQTQSNATTSSNSNVSANSNQMNIPTSNNNFDGNDTSEIYSIIGNRPRYDPKIKITNRGRSSTADNGILASDLDRTNLNNNYYSHTHNINPNTAATSSNTNNLDYNNYSEFYSLDDNDVDRYWEKTPMLPNGRQVSSTIRPFASKTYTSTAHRKSSSLSPTRRLKKTFHSNNSDTNHVQNSNQDWFHNGKFDQRDVATDSVMEQKYIAQARIHSFRDLRGNQQCQQNQHIDDDNMSIPTFARPPRIIKHSFHTNTNNMKHSHGPHLATVQETSSVKDLLDDHYASGNDSNDGPSGLVRSTSSITLDMDNDGISVLTEQYSHLDPKQMARTQQNISFRLQTPPVYADSTAGDLIQSSSFASPSIHTYDGIRQQQHQQQPNHSFANDRNVAPTSSMNMSQPVNNVMNFAGRHMNVGFVAPPAPTWDVINNTFAIPQQRYQQQFQQQHH